ncbi:nucleotide-diphospho-sugar transferase [Infundibulicybe gibba]|nr:nucleotide-diphospho-sugar transferase [Infundibulicybe gibba]
MSTLMPLISLHRISSSPKRPWPAQADTPTRWPWRSPAVLVFPLAVLIFMFGVIERLARPYSHHLDNYQSILHDSHSPERRAIVSVLYSDSYAIAAAVLAHSVHRANVSARLVLPFLPDRISPHALCIVRTAGWEPLPAPYISPQTTTGMHPRDYDQHQHQHQHQFTKLSVWALDNVGIDAAVYLDADTLVLRPFDELFHTPWAFAAVPEAHRAHTGFSAGVFALRTSSAVFQTAQVPAHDAEQAFLNTVFGAGAAHLPYAYNTDIALKHRAPALWAAMRAEMRIPFADDAGDPGVIYTEEELLRIARGRYREEVGWWRAAYVEMMRNIGRQVTACATHYPRTVLV